MAFENRYPNRKDWRKPYFKSGRFDRTCRPNGGCPYCKENRFHGDKIKELSAKEQVEEMTNFTFVSEDEDTM